MVELLLAIRDRTPAEEPPPDPPREEHAAAEKNSVEKPWRERPQREKPPLQEVLRQAPAVIVEQVEAWIQLDIARTSVYLVATRLTWEIPCDGIVTIHLAVRRSRTSGRHRPQCVTYVSGLERYPCARLHTASPLSGSGCWRFRSSSGTTSRRRAFSWSNDCLAMAEIQADCGRRHNAGILNR